MGIVHGSGVRNGKKEKEKKRRRIKDYDEHLDLSNQGGGGAF